MNVHEPHAPPVPAAPSPFRFPVRVYWEDTDAGGIVYYANYLKFFERARTEWLRTLGRGQQAMIDESGCMFVVQHTAVRFLRPARLDDLLTLTVGVQERGRARLRVAQQAWRDDALLAEGDIRIGYVDRATLKPLRIPAPLLDAIA